MREQAILLIIQQIIPTLLHSYSQAWPTSIPNLRATVQWPKSTFTLLLGHQTILGHLGVGELWTQPGQRSVTAIVKNLHLLRRMKQI